MSKLRYKEGGVWKSIAPSQKEFDDNKAEVTASLAETGERLDTPMITYYPPQSVTPKAYMTIIDDDARIEVLTKLKPLSIAKGVPITLAVPINYPYATTSPRQMTPAELLDLQDTLGWEMASHTYNHPDLRTTTDEQLKIEIIDSKKKLESWGLNIDNIVYPFGSGDGGVNTAHIKELSSKYYKSGANVGGGVNTKPVKSFSLNRVALGSFFETADHTDVYYKSKVDEAISKKGWVIFMTHCHHADHTAEQDQYLSNVIDYALANNVAIVTMREGYKQMGNVMEVEGKFGVGNDGIAREVNTYKSVLKSSTTDVSVIADFDAGTISYKSFDGGTKGTLPEAGTLVTHKPFSSFDYSYQHLYAYSNFVYYRRWLNTTGWQAWQQITTKKTYQISVDCGTLAASTVKNISVATLFPALLTGETCIIQPNNSGAPLPGEVMLSNSGARLHLYNTHTAPFVVGVKLFNVTVM